MRVILIDGPSEGRIVETSIGCNALRVLDPVNFVVGSSSDSGPEDTVYNMHTVQLLGMTIPVGYSCSQDDFDSTAMKYFIRAEALTRISEI